jgi:hypothetical protein
MNKESSCFEEQDVFTWGMEASPETWKSLMEILWHNFFQTVSGIEGRQQNSQERRSSTIIISKNLSLFPVGQRLELRAIGDLGREKNTCQSILGGFNFILFLEFQ